MTRQDQFKAEMAAILAKFRVTMDVDSWDGEAWGINFFSRGEWDEAGNVCEEMIDFRVRPHDVDHTDFQ